ncbi:MAG: 30S ribosomal protein S12 methylthiotransferase RimO, partial [Pseudomonadota bacterium]|nr:30S ribosomal protein S12 methylthiotransferase RimO [Pseudomonadota bacterium]
RWHRFMEWQRRISEARMAAKVGRTIEVIVDVVDGEGAMCRSHWDAPEIDGSVFLNGDTDLSPGDIVEARVEHADYYDLWAIRTTRD